MGNKYQSIMEYISKLIYEGDIVQGGKLPTVRELADKFKCSKSTVLRAFKELEGEHKIYSIPKSGYYLVDKAQDDIVQNKIINFSQVLPHEKLLPYREFNHCINRAVEIYKSSLFTYGEKAGLLSLREVLVKHFAEQQVFTSEDDIVITTGSQQGLSILTRMRFPNNKTTILLEQPTYKLMHKLAEINNINMIGIKRDRHGIDLIELEEIFKKEEIKFFYTIPRFHNPLGTSYNESTKKKIVELANKYDVYIVEDDYLADIEIKKSRLPIHYYDVNDRVIYVKSYAKSFMPGIRIGAVILNNSIRDEFIKNKRLFDLNTSVLAQGALEIYIKTGMYRNHIMKAKKEYKKKMDFVREYLKGYSNNHVEIFIPDTGFFIWITMNEKINMDILRSRMSEQEVIIPSSEGFSIENKEYYSNLRLCISALSIEDIRRGLSVLLREIEKLIYSKLNN
ncbi:aminotransferase-like domain-containing protein [Oceanirhabdus sp. W0125-5]|uniref:aminotransferase-like domain-containing protein n=1 Tax=Oceanirhabdus sp. W0125-5 TaxID=2999116 RepID=UPI0022F3387F|nr:PLP-dependent aminotransferase family protein [Oceanirhabdus sp. W0125-5]WBW97819.1 PLP-dependent aminotransferase family protein [Oceanirhabdus sp. W0125-5]